MGFPGGSVIKNLPKNPPAMQEMWARFLAREGPLEKEMATRFNSLAWEIPWTDEPGGIQYLGSQRVGHDLATKQQQTIVLKLGVGNSLVVLWLGLSSTAESMD